MATYPAGIPSLGTVTGADHLTVAQFNTPNDEIEAICTELGVNPTTIDDTVAPASSPASVAAYLDMVANVFKTMTSTEAWHKSATPSRFVIYGNLVGATVAAGATIYPVVYGKGNSATENQTQIDVPLDVDVDNFWVNVTTAFPSGANDTMEFALRRDGADIFGGKVQIPPGWVGIFHKQMLQFTDLLTAGQKLSVRITMNGSASGPSGALGAWGFEGRQRG